MGGEERLDQALRPEAASFEGRGAALRPAASSLQGRGATADVLEYLRAFGRHWGSLVTGGVLIGLLSFGTSLLEVPTPRSWNIAIGLVALQVAAFLAWRDVRRQLAEVEARPSVHLRHEMVTQDLHGFPHQYHRFVVTNLSDSQAVFGCAVHVLHMEPEQPEFVPGPLIVTDSTPGDAFRPRDIPPKGEQRFDFCFVNPAAHPRPLTLLSRPNYSEISGANGPVHCTLQVTAQNLGGPRWRLDVAFEADIPRIVDLRPA